MSSTCSKVVEWRDDEGETHSGRIRWHHTSDTVHWEVDGKSAYVWSLDEYCALLEAGELAAANPDTGDRARIVATVEGEKSK